MYVIGTAGHIDHGKTTLIKALTGIDTDRLKVEKERGITTELGFAHMVLEDGTRVSIVDAPGHERFVRHMIAGAGGLDLAVLLVAADEGVMPQTREHLDILGLVSLKRGFVVLSKCDILGPDDIALAEEDVRDALRGSFLDGAPILRFEGGRPETFGSFKRLFERTLASNLPPDPERPLDRPLKIPVDRTFTIKGFGLVVTGTCTAGRIGVGDMVRLAPDGPSATVRGIQVHGSRVDFAHAGTRVAVNLHGCGRESIRRGQVLTTLPGVTASHLLDVDVTLLSRVKRPIHGRASVVVHAGTDKVDGSVVLLDPDTLEPGGSSIAQLRLSRPLAVLPGDPFILRGFRKLEGHGRTVGGGRILFVDHRPRKASDRDSLQSLRVLAGRGDAASQVLAAVELFGEYGVGLDTLESVTLHGRGVVQASLAALAAAGEIDEFTVNGRKHVLGARPRESFGKRLVGWLERIHRERPDIESVGPAGIAGAMPERPPVEVVEAALESAVRSGLVLSPAKGRYRLPGQGPVRVEPELLDRLERIFTEAGFRTPDPASAARAAGLDPETAERSLLALVREGRLVRTSGGPIFARPSLERAADLVAGIIRRNGRATIKDIREVLDTSRKYAVPIAEYLDSQRITLRLPDGTRKLRRQ